MLKYRLRRQSWVSQPESPKLTVQPQFDPQQWWRFWRFRSEAMEHDFQKGSQRLAIILCNIWCVFSLGETISWMGNGLAEGAVTPAQVIYPFTVILVSLVLNNLVPIVRRHLTSFISLECVLMMAFVCYVTHNRAVNLHLELTEAHKAQLGPLLEWVEMSIEYRQRYAVLYGYTLTFPMLLMLTFIGFTKSTVLAMLSIPLSFGLTISVSPALTKSRMVWLMPMLMITPYCILLMIKIAHTHRQVYAGGCKLQHQTEASMKADSMLNHTLKNIMANSAGEIEQFLDLLSVACDTASLQRSLECLQRGMRWCKNRQAYLDLVAGDYVSTLEPTEIKTFGLELVAGRQLSIDFADHCVMLDTRLCDLVLDNALSNAFQHGRVEDPAVRFAIAVSDAPDGGPQKAVSFRVTNRARPYRPPLTDDFVAGLLQGHRPQHRSSPLSDGMGFRHCLTAARAHGIAVSLEQEDDLVTFTARLLADVASRTPPHTPRASERLVGHFPRGLNIYYIDDSAVARQLVERNLSTRAHPQTVRTFGEVPAEAEAFVAAVLADGHIAILDQNLDWRGTCLQGTRLVRQLLAAGFKGLICIRSANNSETDTRGYLRSGAHCVLGKELPMKQAVDAMKAAYVRHARAALFQAECRRMDTTDISPGTSVCHAEAPRGSLESHSSSITSENLPGVCSSAYWV